MPKRYSTNRSRRSPQTFGGKNGLPGYRVMESKDNHLAYLSEMGQTNRRETASFGRRPKAKKQAAMKFSTSKKVRTKDFQEGRRTAGFSLKGCFPK